MNVKLIDVAQLAGVDISTASRVLRGESMQRIREETRGRILASARQLNYAPNELARGLRTARSKTFGIVVPQLDNPVFSTAIEGAELSARRHGYSLLIAHRQSGATDSVYRRLAHGNRVDGLLVASLDDQALLKPELDATNVPFVLLNRKLAGAAHCVVLDSRAAAEIAVDHLVSLGHRRIAHLAGRPGGFNAGERLAGYRAALRRHGIRFDARLVAVAGYTAEGGAAAMRSLLPQRPTAVLGATLVSAAGAMMVLHEARLQIPADISVIGLHDALVATMLYPPLTTVRMPTERMGELATDLLVALTGHQRVKAVAPLPPDGLVIRASTGPVAG
ncbi:LacI family DNA-binding transcriptional regulator [Verminephrobacter eiseniae]|uniref:LacI family DNA-binding transcriptional regulator n=1 Tax=Verminephrobacter eiseniae TaxID=364317 RepID=UPI00223737CE|nr:LacI family DNA-binding transcriptional regulator [Verminephrobacter eiseniae]MCW5234665.1 LacI family transcriptional regulator [Verminephrobacter eiseniae]MCW5293760.1 LacI family transcriptional regulator [Verminephrobacter eiseniae]MCW8186022.1 LacI family transcriptional regulator [Verminephrobacter eiseniae]MCW8221885.1 LacI family transcriptional regulator [Verminephrobacter eiseniae]MCW8235723.1 LacI family transcriptional regulator [Verminephrobacter eiseniae]